MSLQLFHGSGDMIEMLEDAIERVKSGEMEGVVVVGATSDGALGWSWAYKEDATHIWARLIAAQLSAHQEMMAEGL